VVTASDNGKAANPGEESHEPRECMPCRGTGRVITNLGGTSEDVACPWCEGGGTRLAAVDAQAHWPDGAGEKPADGELRVDGGTSADTEPSAEGRTSAD
jgi:DnaJ-class molecular chaperone